MDLWFSEQHTKNVKLSIRVDKQLCSRTSEFQRIDVFDSPEFGRFLVLDGYMMLTEKDEFIYHEMITHVPMAVHPRVRDVLILGGGRISLYLGSALIESGIRVRILERNEEHCEIIKGILPRAEILLGDGTNPKVLEEEGIRTTDAFVALTGSDQNNIITSMFAARSGAGKVITKVNDDCFRRMVDSHKLDSFVTPKNIAADNIVTYVRAMQNSIDASGIESLHEIADGNAEVLEFSIKRPAEYLDIPLRSLSIRRDTLLAAIIRGNECIIPGGNDCVRMHDSVIAVTTRFGMQRFDDIFEE